MKEYIIDKYISVYLPTHHRARKNGYVYEHIIVAEEKLGRQLKNTEVVHHIDGNKHNNNPDNLMVFVSNSAHTRFHKTNECIKNDDGTYDSPVPEKFCKNCGKKLHLQNSTYCLECYKKILSKDVPTKEELISIIEKYNGNFIKIGEFFNKSDSAIRKWCKKYNLPYHSSDYKPKKQKKEKKPIKKPVNQLDINTNEIIVTFPSCNDAARHLNKKKGTHITEVCNGKLNSAYGYKWEYIDN